MNIKELVLVISILLSIRIAEYAMKKYKEQKDVEVTKKQKSRKQTKKYIITAQIGSTRLNSSHNVISRMPSSA